MSTCGQMDIKPKDPTASAGLNWRNKPRRAFTPEQRLAMVQECAKPGVSVSEVAQRNRVNTNLLFKWRRLHASGQLVVAGKGTPLLPVTVVNPKASPRRMARAESKRKYRGRSSDSVDAAVRSSGAIEVELAGARIYLHGVVSESNLLVVLKALACR